jgi:hypothetical protein
MQGRQELAHIVAESSGHDVMVDQPAWLADILLQVS